MHAWQCRAYWCPAALAGNRRRGKGLLFLFFVVAVPVVPIRDATWSRKEIDRYANLGTTRRSHRRRVLD